MKNKRQYGTPLNEPYAGVENLEIMEDAVKYNQYLSELVLTYALSTDLIVDFGTGLGTFAIFLRGMGHQVCCSEPDTTLAGKLAKHGFQVCPNLTMLEDASVDYLYTLITL